MNNAIDFSIDKLGVANLIFDLPDEKVNKLSENVLNELQKAINVIDGNKAIRVVLISSAKKNIFIAGADINEIKDLKNTEEAKIKVAKGQEILNKLAKIKIPTISVINGACLGGGLELALACKYRIGVINDKTQLGLPEVNLGIIPGFGGTQRLPALVGLEESLNIILSGKSINLEKSYKIGLVDDVISQEFLEEELTKIVSEIIKNPSNNKYLSKRSSDAKKRFYYESILLNKYLIFYFAKKKLFEKTKGQYLAPFFALEVIKKTYKKTYGVKGFKTELEAFVELVVGNISKNLIQIFFTSEALKKDNFSDSHDVKIKEINNISLVGAGVMGGGIAWLFANYDFQVRIKDIAKQSIANGYHQILKIFNQFKKNRKLNANQISMKMSNISFGTDYVGFENSDIVIEAVIEDINIKKNIFAEIENKVPNDAIIVSNTSSLSISEMQKVLINKSRFAGMHFFNPVNKMPLIEVIKAKDTSIETVASIVSLSKKIGKTPIVVSDVPGFLVNRILLTYLNEAAYLLQDSFSIEKIDSEIEKFGLPMGPFKLVDIVGIDVGYKVAKSLEEGYGSRMKVALILDEIFNNHKKILGVKSRLGFYIYDKNDKAISSNYDIYKILDNIEDKLAPISKKDDSEIIERCILTMINEASKCLEEKVVKSAEYLDMAMILGSGFPPFRGGILKYADKIGIENVVKKLKLYNQKYKERFQISNYLLEMLKNKESFYK